ncbi:hypothetical protein E4U41_003408 [Claviceps citrina]|nr:hypothetical protein E4U41_003408 [Claviceps citrina]
MPRKKPVDTKAMGDPKPADVAARKACLIMSLTERSHEENQERAYIAASRRADRSIEARVQSARMASEIHKKRTGKGFKITDDIVLKEEMYEEEDDDLPRSYRLLSASMETSSPEMNLRLDAYLSNKMAMSQMLARTNDEWRANEVNRLFAASFPHALPTTPQQQLPMPGQTLTYQHASPEAFSPPISPTTTAPPTSYSPSFSAALATPPPPPVPAPPPPPPLLQGEPAPSRQLAPRAKPPRRKSRASESGVKSRRNSSKSSTTVAKKKSHDNLTNMRTTPTLDSSILPQALNEPDFSTGSAFTTELPPEARMIMDGVGADAVLDQTLANLDLGNFSTTWLDTANFPYNMYFPRTEPMAPNDAFAPELCGNVAEGSMAAKCSNEPFCEGGLDWRSFINDCMWTND